MFDMIFIGSLQKIQSSIPEYINWDLKHIFRKCLLIKGLLSINGKPFRLQFATTLVFLFNRKDKIGTFACFVFSLQTQITSFLNIKNVFNWNF